MSLLNRLTEVFELSEKLPFDDSSKFILFSDCHRGDNSWADDFAQNQTLFFRDLHSLIQVTFLFKSDFNSSISQPWNWSIHFGFIKFLHEFLNRYLVTIWKVSIHREQITKFSQYHLELL